MFGLVSDCTYLIEKRKPTSWRVFKDENILLQLGKHTPICILYTKEVKAPLILFLEIHSTAFLKYLPDLKHSIQFIKISAKKLIVESDVLDKEDAKKKCSVCD